LGISSRKNSLKKVKYFEYKSPEREALLSILLGSILNSLTKLVNSTLIREAISLNASIEALSNSSQLKQSL